MKCEICGTPYKFYYPEFREIEQQCVCRPVGDRCRFKCSECKKIKTEESYNNGICSTCQTNKSKLS